MLWKCLNLLSLFVVYTEPRGPHHPRGENIVKRHVHYTPSKNANEKLTEDMQLLHDKEHIQEHLEDLIPDPDFSKMSDAELEFYYFQVHDSDKNSKLDGLELLQAILHTDENYGYQDDDEEHVQHDDSPDFNYYVELIDQVLEEDDVDHDGYLSYSEYVSQRRLQNKNAVKKTTR
ncbi:multiple coagulation factor deficiency protein 2 homolog [Diorhabda carinulata]|uniref:multiple coagulation factor deficiency protein 2 homolog n=1 Tax=Diorhabda carinulata TaxID=1163345 RepID=UPI0025A04913|nr:multiple coagulation factor deficiency protein 2 homolog [Diorhabda carinulata]